MSDVTHALAAKSDQLNAVDIMGNDLVIKIRDVKVTKTDAQPVWIYFEGDNNRPWKPSKGMLRILAAAWGNLSENWIGKHAQLFMNPSVRYAGKEVGGIQIRALSDIAQPLDLVLTLNRQTRNGYRVEVLTVKTEYYPDDKFYKAVPVMISKMQSGEMTLQQVIAQCQKTGRLSQEQLKALEEHAPIEINENEEIE